MSSDNDLLLRRLIGAATVFVGAFLLAWLLPQPEDGKREPDGTVVLRMRAPEPGLRPERVPQAETAAEASESPKEAIAPVGERATAETPPPAEQEPAAVAESTSDTAPGPEPEPASEPAPEPEQPAPAAAVAEGGDWWVQAAAYSDRAAARRGRERVAADFSAGSRLREVRVDGRRFWRLQVGPLPREAAAEALAERLRDKGFQGARVFRETGR